MKSAKMYKVEVYRNNLKNRFLTASAFSQNSHLRSRLVHAQWPLAPDENFEKPPCQFPDSSGCFGIRSWKLGALTRSNTRLFLIIGINDKDTELKQMRPR